MSGRIPDILLERLRLGELDPMAAERLRTRMTPEDEARMSAMEADDADTLAAHPPRVVALAVRQRAAAERRPSRLWMAVPLVAVAAAVALFALRPEPVEPVASASPDITRAKGDDRLLVFRRTAGGNELLDDGARAGAGDELQLALVMADARHAAVLSVDGRGAVTTHYPVGGAASPVDAGRHALDHAFALDDAPRYERFVLVTAETPIDLETVRSALQDAGDGPLALPDGWQQSTVTLRKGAAAEEPR